MEPAVLVLNQNYDPINVCNARRAFTLLYGGKAEVLEHGLGVLRSPSFAFPLPSVIRLVYMVKRPRPQMRLTRREVFMRDRHTCQYCGRQARELTLDHVFPRHRGGRHTWENLVAACKGCNHRKAGRTPSEARMLLSRAPYRPRVSSYYLFYQYLDVQHEWRKFIPGWDEASIGIS